MKKALHRYLFVFLLIIISIFSYSCDNDSKNIGEISVFLGSEEVINHTGIYDFGSLDVGVTSPEITFTIKNEGDGKLKLTGDPKIEVSGTDATSFIVDDSKTSSSIVPGVSTTFTVKLNVTSLGLKTAIITIASNDEINGSFTFTLVGKGVPIYEWTKVIGSAYNKNVTKTKTDSLGNIYITGTYNTSVDFGADFGVSDIKICTTMAMFITKILSDGSYGWTRQFSGSYPLGISSIAFDSKNDIYLTGSFTGSIDFGLDFGTHDILATAGNSDIFISKIRSNGDYGWTKILGSSYTDYGKAIACDSDDNIYFSSTFYKSVDFGAPFGSTDIKTATTSNASAITKINSNGSYGWTKQIGDYGLVDILDLTLDNIGNIYIVGSSSSIVNYADDFGSTDIKGFNYQSGFFVSKITSGGTYGWTKIVYSSNSVSAISIAVDSSQNIYVSGFFEDAVDFGNDFGISDTRAAIQNIHGNSVDAFVMKINSDTSYGWVRQFGSEREDYLGIVAVDSFDNVYFANSFRFTMDFGMDFGIIDSNKENNSRIKTFLTKIKPDGSYCWSKCLEHANFSIEFTTMSISAKNDIILIGSIEDTFDFGNPFDSTDVKTANGTDNYVYIVKLQG